VTKFQATTHVGEATMEAPKLLRFGGMAAVLGGAAIALYNSVEYMFFSGAPLSALANLPGWLAFQIAGLFAIAFVVIGLFGLYAVQAQRAGKVGLVGFALALAGVLMYVGTTWAAAFLMPAVGRAAPAILDAPDPLAGAGVISTILISSVGWILFGVATLRAGVFPRWASILMLVGAIVPFVTQSVGVALPLGPVALGVALAWMGYSTLVGSLAPARVAVSA
jgi:hypothetical protein